MILFIVLSVLGLWVFIAGALYQNKADKAKTEGQKILKFK